MKKLYTLICLAMCLPLLANAQDPSFTQTQATGIYLNPANAGHYDGINLNLIGRIQYMGLGNSNAYKSMLASVDGYGTRNSHVAFGGYFLTDQAGASHITSNTIQFMASHYVDFGGLRRNQNVLRYGLGLGFAQRSVNYNDLVFRDQLGLLGRSSTSAEGLSGLSYASLGNIAGGLKMTLGGNTFIGGSFQYYYGNQQNFITSENVPDILFQPRFLFELRHKRRLPKPSGLGRYQGLHQKNIGKFDLTLEPYLLFRNQGSLTNTQYRQLDAGALLTYQEIRLGVTYRGLENSSALCFIVGIEVKTLAPKILAKKKKRYLDDGEGFFRVFYTYDAGIAGLARGFGATHELSLSYHIKPRKSMRPSEECPNSKTTHAFFKH